LLGFWTISASEILNTSKHNFPKPDFPFSGEVREISTLLGASFRVRIYKTIILPVVQHACENIVSEIKEESKLRMIENRVLGRIFGPKRDGVTGGWRKLHSEELHNLYSSRTISRIIKSRRMRWARKARGKETARKTET
jgi:hypothetical protein